jgi:hypothetical protein
MERRRVDVGHGHARPPRELMATVYEVKSLAELGRLFGRHQSARKRRVVGALRRVAARGVGIVKRKVPVAFGELRESVDSKSTPGGATVEADAPHAAAVEVGSRPHTPPLEPILAWVKLRAAQGLLTERQIDRLPGTSTAGHARSMAAQMRGMEESGAIEVDAPRRIAFAIQQKIARAGTQPTWFMRQSLPEIVRELDTVLKDALAKE